MKKVLQHHERIPLHSKTQLDDLKKTVPMWMAAQSRLDGMSKRGTEYDFLCPYHEDTVPSFQIYQKEDGIWFGHCQACGVTKNIFQLIGDVDKVNFNEAVKIVEDMIHSSDWSQKKAEADAVFQNAVKANQDKITMPLENFDSYVEALKNSEVGQEWLRSRGISAATAENFSLGFVQTPLPTIVHTDHPWRDKGWILFPEIRSGRIVSVKYRSLMGKRITVGDKNWSGFAHRKDMLGSTMYNLEAMNILEDVLIAEGEPDCLILSQAGFCSASLPSAGFNPTPEMRDAMMRASSRYLAGDTDEIGIDAMNKVFRELGGDNPKSRTYILQWPKPYKDANEVFLKVCKGRVIDFSNLVLQLMEDARNRRVPGIRDLKTVTRTANFKPTRDNPNRIYFPWQNIDKWVDILPGEVMYLFATETKTGKSTFLMNILIHNVLKGKKIVNFSAELTPDRYAQIVTAHLLHRNRDYLTDADFQAAAKILPEDSFYIGYKPGAKFPSVMKLLADAKQVYGGDIFVLDPLHFIIRGSENENRDFAEAMRELVDFSVKWNVVVIVVGQAKKGKGRGATGQDARGTAAQGEDAATTWIIHRNRIGRVATDEDEEGEPVFEPITQVKLDYSRNSNSMSAKLIFDGSTASFNPYSNRTAPLPVDISAETGQM